jgi:hypothetical protein
VLICGDAVKIIDILYTDTLESASTTSKKARVRKDLSSLKHLLADLLAKSDVGIDRERYFTQCAGACDSLDEIAEAFESATTLKSDANAAEVVNQALAKVVDSQFVESATYAAALADETADNVVFPLMLRIATEGVARPEHRRYLSLLWNRLTPQQAADVANVSSDLLDRGLPTRGVPQLILLSAGRSNAWRTIPIARRLRIESIITKDAASGSFHYHFGMTQSGALGTWAASVGEHFDDRDGLIAVICSRLRSDWYTQNYVGQYMMRLLPRIADTAARKKAIMEALRRAIDNDARVVKANLQLLPREWVLELERSG